MTSARRLLVVVVLALSATGAAQLGSTRLTVTPVAERPTARPGGEIRLALDVPIPGNLHIQSDAPRDRSLIPARVTFDAVPGVTVKEVVFPGAVDLTIVGFDEPQAVFEGRLLVGVTVAIDETVGPGPLTLPARFRYQACDASSCFPPTTVPVSWTIAVAADGGREAREHADVFSRIAFGTGAPPPPPTLATSTPLPGVTLPVDRATPDDVLSRFDRFEIMGVSGGYQTTSEFLEFIDNAEKGVTPAGLFDGRGPLAILALVFVGGLALNLTPCVLPMIPINLMIIGAGASSGRRGRGFLLGSAYGSAMALVYGVIGLVVILTAGTFGTVNASPWFNLAIAVLFVVLGLAMFDVIAIDLSRYSSNIRFNQESRGSLMLAFGMGAVAALLAGACVAPVVIQVVVFASDMYARGDVSSLALPFVLGLGMALPWPLAGAGFSALPKPGAWMVRVKQVMGAFILATALYYGYVAYGIFASRWVDPSSVTASVNEMLEAGWHASIVEGLDTAERERKPVLIDFWATWCKNCLTMDKTTLVAPEVKAALDGYVTIKFQAEDPDTSPAKELLERVRGRGGVGLPTYVIARPR